MLVMVDSEGGTSSMCTEYPLWYPNTQGKDGTCPLAYTMGHVVPLWT